MARPTSRKKSELSMAVAELRTRLGVSQQEFSNRMGVALNTIARYESSREPDGVALLRLAGIARSEGHSDLAEIFHDEFGHWITNAARGSEIAFATYAPPSDSGLLTLTLHSPEEAYLAMKFLVVFSHWKRSQNKRERDELLHVLDSAADAIDQQYRPKGKKRK
jgi:transcriptional regulator with XRE-family HTH domain